MSMFKLNQIVSILFLSVVLQISACADEVSNTNSVSIESEPSISQADTNLVKPVVEAESTVNVYDERIKIDSYEPQETGIVVEGITAADLKNSELTLEQQNTTKLIQASATTEVQAVTPAESEELSEAQVMLNLAQYKGKVVYLDFWASWCGPCKESFPWMYEMQEKYPDDLVVIAVNLDEVKSNAEQFLEAYDVNFRIVFDQDWKAGHEYEIFGLPFSFVYNRQGELVGKHGGFAPGDEINLEAALNNLFARGE